MKSVGALMVFLGGGLVVGAFWEWAIFGMDHDVGTAIGVTCAVLILAGGTLVGAGDDDAADS